MRTISRRMLLSGASSLFATSALAQFGARRAAILTPKRVSSMVSLPQLGLRSTSTADFNNTPAWLGRKADVLLQFFAPVVSGVKVPDWPSVMTEMASVMSDIASHTGRVFWSVPLNTQANALTTIPGGGSDTYFDQMFDTILAKDRNAKVYIRLGWEFNLYSSSRFPWDSSDYDGSSHAAEYVAAWRYVVTRARSRAGGSRLFFIWCWNAGGVRSSANYIDIEPSYPGDAYVDGLGPDCYFATQDDMTNVGRTEAQAWDKKLTTHYSLNYTIGAANNGATRTVGIGKPLFIPEWGIDRDSAYLHQQFASFFRANGIVVANYWNKNVADGLHMDRVSDGQYPASLTEFVRQWGVFQIVSASAITGGAGYPISLALQANRSGVTWSIVSGSGFSLSGSTLTLAASTAGTYTATVQATEPVTGARLQQTITFTAAALWTPASLGSGLGDWFDASDTSTLTKDGSTGAVSAWGSKVGTGRSAVQATGTKQPIWSATARNGLPGIAFDGTDDFLSMSSVTGVAAGQAAFTLAVALYGDAALGTFKHFVSQADAGTNYRSLMSSGSGFARFMSSGNVQDSSSAQNKPLVGYDRTIVGGSAAGATVTGYLYIDGGATAVINVAMAMQAFTPARMLIGAQPAASNGVTGFAKATIAEIVTLTRELTATERDKLSGYLAWHNGTVANLPSDHPYKLLAPY